VFLASGWFLVPMHLGYYQQQYQVLYQTYSKRRN